MTMCLLMAVSSFCGIGRVSQAAAITIEGNWCPFTRPLPLHMLVAVASGKVSCLCLEAMTGVAECHRGGALRWLLDRRGDNDAKDGIRE